MESVIYFISNRTESDKVRKYLKVQEPKNGLGVDESLKLFQNKILSKRYKIAILDITGEDPIGLFLVNWISEKAPSVRSIVISDRIKHVYHSLLMGAKGCVPSNELENIPDAIESVLNNKFYIPQEISSELCAQINNKKILIKQKREWYLLTEIQRDIIKLRGQGLFNSKIAYDLCKSPKTITNQVTKVLKKINSDSIEEAVTYFAEILFEERLLTMSENE